MATRKTGGSRAAARGRREVTVIAPRGQRKVAGPSREENPLPPARASYAPNGAPSRDEAVRALSHAWFDEYVGHGKEAERKQALYVANKACIDAGCAPADIERAATLAWEAALFRTKPDPFRSNPETKPYPTPAPRIENPEPPPLLENPEIAGLETAIGALGEGGGEVGGVAVARRAGVFVVKERVVRTAREAAVLVFAAGGEPCACKRQG